MGGDGNCLKFWCLKRNEDAEKRTFIGFSDFVCAIGLRYGRKFSFENAYHDLVALVTDGLKTSVPEHSEESENLEENPKTAVVPKDDEPASWLIKNGCKLNSVTVDSDGSRTWKLRCPNSRWVTLVDTNLQ